MEAQPSEHMIMCNISYQNTCKQVSSFPKEWKGSYLNLNRWKFETRFATL